MRGAKTSLERLSTGVEAPVPQCTFRALALRRAILLTAALMLKAYSCGISSDGSQLPLYSIGQQIQLVNTGGRQSQSRCRETMKLPSLVCYEVKCYLSLRKARDCTTFLSIPQPIQQSLAYMAAISQV